MKIKNKNNFIAKIKNKIKNFWKKNITKNKTKFNIKEAVILMIITFAFGLILGGVIMYGKGFFGGNSSSLNEFISTYNDIINTYYQDVDADLLLDAGLSGMINYLGDPYAAYMSKEATDDFNENVEGEYVGIGLEIIYNNINKTVKIGEVFEGGPAEKAGILTDDILLKVDDKSIEGMTSTDIAKIVKGTSGTNVKITIKRDNQELDFDIKREKVDIQNVTSDIYEEDNHKIGYIDIAIFASNTFKQFEKELLSLEEQNIDSLIIDVRGNSGGYLTTVTDIISLFTKKDSVIYQLKTKDEIESISDKTDTSRDYPIVVLVDALSASASEVLCGALKENYGATVVGIKSFGKGKVQKAYTLSNGSMVKYTFQEWLTPLGNSIDGVGIVPDIEINFEGIDKEDNQLGKAIEILLQEK